MSDEPLINVESSVNKCEIPAWAEAAIEDFKNWAAELPCNPALENNNAGAETPDLYSFYKELCVLRTDIRTNARRTHETFSRFSDVLGRLDEKLGTETGNKVERSADERRMIMAILDISERLQRMEQELGKRPKHRILGNHSNWMEWADTLEGAFEIISKNLDGVLQTHGVERIETNGEEFNPHLMTAVAVDSESSYEDGCVTDEVSPGYLLDGEVLKFAEVKIAKAKKEE